jgi:DNA-binding HxlR family transcriptional regulator
VKAEPTPLSPGGTNAVGRILGLVGDEWTLLIIQQALLGATRYGEFLERLPISNTVLSKRLRALTENDLLVRSPYQIRPVRAEYLITQRGRAFWPVLLSIWEWERRWVPDHLHQLPGMRHTRCGGDFAPVLTCQACGEPVTEKEVAARWGPSGSWPRSIPEGSTRRRSGADGKRGQAGLFPATMSVFGNRWAAALLVCAFLGTSRFSDFQTQLGAPPSLLSGRLQTFCANGVLCTSRETNYQLTERGRAFFPVIIAALQVGQHWFHAPEGPAVTLTHLGCGKPFVGQLTCDQCARPLKGAHIRVDYRRSEATSAHTEHSSAAAAATPPRYSP